MKATVLRNLDRKLPRDSNSRVRNFLAKGSLGSAGTTIFENVLGVGAFVPWHRHSVEEIIITFEGQGECETEDGVEGFGPGEVVIIPSHAFHTVRSVGAEPLRVLAVFPSADVDPGTFWRDPISSQGNSLEDANV